MNISIWITNWASTKNKPSAKEIDISGALLSRDYKGFSNQGMTGVLVIEKVKDE